MVDFSSPVSRLKGVGESAASKLSKLGIETAADLVEHYPRRYEDFSRILPIRALRAGPVTIKGTIHSIASRRATRRNLTITEAIIADDTGTVKAVWFNQPYLKTAFPIGLEVYVSGRLEFKNNDLALQSPAIEPADSQNKNTARIVPVYSETAGLTTKQIRGFILPLLDHVRQLPETLPDEIIKAAKLMSRGEALAEIHYPSSNEKLEQAKHRLAFEELFYPILTSLVIKKEVQTETGPQIPVNIDVIKEFIGLLGFELTDSQRKAAWQILQDLQRSIPMNRLLEGDVGSGKTVVAMVAAIAAMGGGYQVALMVPTDILARQHAAKVEGWMAQMGFRSQMLVGQAPVAVKRATYEAIKSGQVDLIIGTHALLSETVEFANLGLVVIDEQHRFGVNQRQMLKQKAGRLPHLLSMTATPIPRSLALTVYGDLDVTVISQLPVGRKPIKTEVAGPEEREDIYAFVDDQIEQGRQVFVVCPLVNESDKLGAKSVIAEAERLKQSVFSHRRVGLIHGRLGAAEKEAVMAEFVQGSLDILVSTSVIEVGIDVPNATVMVIEDAERFGLAALHQMRGRIGRGKHRSFCFLIYGKAAAEFSHRLLAMEKSADGFRLAQIDLELRGPGQIYGTQQHGVLDLNIADITDTRLVSAVRKLAEDFLSQHDSLQKFPQLAERINALKTVTTLD
jgi:ATP-dependent DNA helicase RecG